MCLGGHYTHVISSYCHCYVRSHPLYDCSTVDRFGSLRVKCISTSRRAPYLYNQTGHVRSHASSSRRTVDECAWPSVDCKGAPGSLVSAGHFGRRSALRIWTSLCRCGCSSASLASCRSKVSSCLRFDRFTERVARALPSA